MAAIALMARLKCYLFRVSDHVIGNIYQDFLVRLEQIQNLLTFAFSFATMIVSVHGTVHETI